MNIKRQMANDEEKGLTTQPSVATVEEERERTVWHSCCGLRCDRSVVLFATKSLFSGVVLAFAMYNIISNHDPCKDLSFSTGLVGMIAGSYIEQGSSQMLKK